MMRLSWVFAATTLVACGGTKLAADSNNQGTGTNTLSVRATIDAQSSGNGPQANYRVDVVDGAGNAVSGATVTFNNSTLGTVTLTEDAVGSGRYTDSASFADGDFTLNVTRGSDKLQGVVGNPGTFAIKAPAVNAIVNSATALAVMWTAPKEAEGASIQTRDMNNAMLVPDTGSWTLPGTQNPPNQNQNLTISRSNGVELAGGLPGSSIQLSYQVSVDYTVQ